MTGVLQNQYFQHLIFESQRWRRSQLEMMVAKRGRTKRPIRVLDLANLPPTPSIFTELPDSLEIDPITTLSFLHAVADNISRPIARDDRVHVGYVPTQVGTEYFRAVRIDDGKLLDGIRIQEFASQRNIVGPSRTAQMSLTQEMAMSTSSNQTNGWSVLRQVTEPLGEHKKRRCTNHAPKSVG